MAEHDLIEDYLQRLRDRLGRGAATDDAVAEVSDHLHETLDAEVARGLTPETAALAVLQRFGPADQVARRLRESRATLPDRWRRPTGATGLAAAVLLIGSTVTAMYLAIRGGVLYRPNAEMVRSLMLAAGYLALLFFLLRQTRRLTGGRRVVAATLTVLPLAMQVIAVLGAILLVPYTLVPFGMGTIAIVMPAVLSLLLAAGVAMALPPWSTAIDDARWARWIFAAGVVGLPAMSAVINATALPTAWSVPSVVIPLVSWFNVLLPVPVIVGLVGLSLPLVRSASSKWRTATG